MHGTYVSWTQILVFRSPFPNKNTFKKILKYKLFSSREVKPLFLSKNSLQIKQKNCHPILIYDFRDLKLAQQ